MDQCIWYFSNYPIAEQRRLVQEYANAQSPVPSESMYVDEARDQHSLDTSAWAFIGNLRVAYQ